jgi:hypothetical protein
MGDAHDAIAPAREAPSPASARVAAPGAGAVASLATPAGVRALQRAIGNAATGRLLARDHVLELNAPAEREIGPNDRPPAPVFFAAYSKVSYDVWKKGRNPSGQTEQQQQNGPWAFIGGSVGKMFGATDPADPDAGPRFAQHTCAGRLSWALNYCGQVAARINGGVMFRNDPGTSYGGKAGDGLNYIVGAPAMQSYLTKKWGPPDGKLGALDQYDASNRKTAEGDASALRTSLGPEGVAVFAGAHHVGVISQKLKTDDYIYYDPDVVPAVYWILPPR